MINNGKEKNKYFKCDGKKCELINLDDLSSSCDTGSLIKEDNIVKFCVDNKSSNSVGFSHLTEERIIYAKNSVLFNNGNDDYLLISISENSIKQKDISNSKN